jgi:hypothetical protein
MDASISAGTLSVESLISSPVSPDSAGTETTWFNLVLANLFHIGVGRAYKRTRVILLVVGKQVRILDDKHRLIKAFALDPTRAFQPQN